MRHSRETLKAAMLVLFVLLMTETIVSAHEDEILEEATARPRLNDTDDKWLVDRVFYDPIKIYEEQETDSQFLKENSSVELCPQVPKELPAGACAATQCISDKLCEERQLLCCFNGCIYTCLPGVKPPSQIDWIIEPRRRLQDGLSWLISGPDDNIGVGLCSTSFNDDGDDADPLVCPHGYECSIDDPGKPEEEIPNRGRCVKIRDVSEQVPQVQGMPTERPKKSVDIDKSLQGDAPYKTPTMHGCLLGDGWMLLSGHSTKRNGKDCSCQETKLTCKQLKGQDKPIVDKEP